MKRFAAAISIAPFILIFASSVNASEANPQGWQQLITDVRSLELNQIVTVFKKEAVQPLSSGRSPVRTADVGPGERGSGASATLVDTLTIDARALVPLGQIRSHRLAKVPPGKTHLSLLVEQTEYVLYVIESVRDQSSSFRHVTAALVDQLGTGYARFTIDDISGSVVATLKSNGITYRILPSVTHAGTHLVFRLATSTSSLSPPNIAISESIPTSSLIRRLEERHIMAEALAYFQPSGYYVGPLAVTLFGRQDGQDRLGRMDPALVEDPSAIADVVSNLAPLTGSRGDEKFVVERVQRVPGEATDLNTIVITFHQILDGLPVRRRQTLELTETGKVRKLRVALVDASWLPKTTAGNLRSSAAAAIARDAVSQWLGGTPIGQIEALEDFTSLTYDIQEGRTLAPVWRSRYVVRNGSNRSAYHVRINLQSGESVVAPLRMDYLMDIYKTTHNPDPTQVLVWQETAILGFVCQSLLDCLPTNPANEEYSKPRDYHTELKEIWEALGASVCCTAMPARIDTITQADHLVAQGAAWFPNWALLAFSTGDSRFPGIFAHELGHAYLTSYNNVFYIDAIEAQAQAGDETGVATIEGLGDSIGAVYSMMTTYSGDIGTDPWILADGLPYQRDLTAAREWSWLHNQAESFHDRGLAVGNFFHRLESTGFFSSDRLMQLLLEVSATIESGATGAISEDNLREAVDLAIGPGEDALLNAVEYMWFEPLLLIGADVEHWSDPIEDDSHFGHTVFTGGVRPGATFISDDPSEAFWDEFIFVTDAAEEDGAAGTFFYVDEAVFQFEQNDFTVEQWVQLNGLIPSFVHVLASNNLPVGNSEHWAVVLRDDRPSDSTSRATTGTLQLRAGAATVESSIGAWSLWPFDWAHVALVRRGDRGIVFLNGTPVIDDPSIFENFTFSLAGNSRVSFGGWAFGAMLGWTTGWGYYDEVRVTRGARYTETFSPAWFQRFTRLGTP